MHSDLIVELGAAVDADVLLHGGNRASKTEELDKLLTIAGIDVHDKETMEKI